MECDVHNGGDRLRLPSIRIALHRISSISRLSPLPGLDDYALHKSVRVGDNDRGPVQLCERQREGTSAAGSHVVIRAEQPFSLIYYRALLHLSLLAERSQHAQNSTYNPLLKVSIYSRTC